MNFLFLKQMPIKAILSLFIISPRACIRYIITRDSNTRDVLLDAEKYRKVVLNDDFICKSGESKKLFIIASFLPLPYCMKVEGLIGRAMQRKGYHVAIVTNLNCLALVNAYHGGSSGFDIILIERFLSLKSLISSKIFLKRLSKITSSIVEKIKEFNYKGGLLGLHTLATVASERSDGRINNIPNLYLRLKKGLRRSIFLMDATCVIVKKYKPSLVFAMEKGFIGTSEIFYAALENKIDYVQWVGCHEPNSMMLKRYNWTNFRDHPFSISEEDWEKILRLRFDNNLSHSVMKKFDSGYKSGEWFKYKNLVPDLHQQEKTKLMSTLNLDANKRTAVIYSHILNDATLFYGKDLFKGGYEEWLVETVRAAADNKSVNWVLKLHPANISRNTKSAYTGNYGELLALEAAFDKIPEFLHIILPDESISPLSFFKITDYGITVRGTVGLELPCFGIPTLTAGTGRYSGKGFTIDSESRFEYLDKVKNIHKITPLSAEQIDLAMRYAYCIFYARPARYGEIFNDVYEYPIEHPRFRDVNLDDAKINQIITHPQMELITKFLDSKSVDFFDHSFLPLK